MTLQKYCYVSDGFFVGGRDTGGNRNDRIDQRHQGRDGFGCNPSRDEVRSDHCRLIPELLLLVDVFRPEAVG